MIKNGWYTCPFCGQKIFPIKTSTVVKDLELKCKNCKRFIEVSIEPRANEPRAD